MNSSRAAARGQAAGQQLGGQVRVERGERPPLVHDPGPGDERVGRRYPPGRRRVPQLAGEGDEALVPLAQPVQVPGPGRDLAVGGTELARNAVPVVMSRSFRHPITSAA